MKMRVSSDTSNGYSDTRGDARERTSLEEFINIADTDTSPIKSMIYASWLGCVCVCVCAAMLIRLCVG